MFLILIKRPKKLGRFFFNVSLPLLFRTRFYFIFEYVKERINSVYYKVSRIGLLPHEGVKEQREVVFLNRFLGVMPLIMAIYIPLEIFFNGTNMLPVVSLMIVLFLLPLLLHHFRWFSLARTFIFLIANIMLTAAGLMVGKGINNHVALIPVVLIATILFKTKEARFVAFLVTAGFFFLQHFLFEIVEPTIYISPNIKTSFSVIFFILALTLTFLSGVYFLRINSEYEAIVNAQKEALAIKNSEVTASITYARRIQNAILPPSSKIKELIPDSFVFYRPKDIVAGDFYWLEKIDEKILVAAADSTGHGVPGAMVSVVCNNALSRAVKEYGLKSPSAILDKTREIIVSEFEKSEEDVKDGMDISLVSLVRTKSENENERSDSRFALTLDWAGANNPLLIVRKGELIEIKPDKQPVGKFSGARPFTNHTITLEAGDLLYLFSDGFSDQFGGPDGKKYKYKAFKNLLLDNAVLPLAQQEKALENAFTKWRGALEQVDDICIIGIKI